MELTGNRSIFEHESVVKASLHLALPCVIGQVILVLYNMADTFFIGMSGDDAKMTALTISMPAFMLLSAISNLFGIGGASAISRAMGSEDDRRTGLISSYAFWACVLTTIAYSAIVAVFRNPIADMLGGTDPRVHGYAVEYLIVCVSLGGLATSLSALMSHLLRAEGRSFISSFGIMLGGILNMILDPIFMFVIMPKGQEVLGAAIATALSNLLSGIFFLIAYLSGRRSSKLSFAITCRSDYRIVRADVLGSGLPACMMTLCENVSYAVLDKILSSYGIMVQAGIGVAKKINMMAHSIVRGMAQGVLPLIGYSYGAGDMKRMHKALVCSASFSVASALICMTAFQVFPYELSSIFLQSGSEAVTYGAKFLRILSIGAPFSAFAYVSISFFQATGEGRKSLGLALMRKGVLDIPMMLMLDKVIPAYGAAMATPIADGICAMTAIVMVIGFMTSANARKTDKRWQTTDETVYTANKAIV